MRKKKLTENYLKTPSSIFTDETQNEFFLKKKMKNHRHQNTGILLTQKENLH